MNINRSDLVDQLVAKHNYTKKAAFTLVNDFTDIILDNLREGNTVSIRNFGTFDLLERKARSCPNPVTGEKVEVPDHWIPRFYPANKMRVTVKMWEDDVKRGIK